MTNEEIEKAFNGRWRMKNYILENIDGKAAKEIARDFFEAGILLGEGEHSQPIPMSAIERASYQVVGFDQFWNLYDKKIGRPKCEKLWSKLTNKEMEECIAYIPLYKQAQPDKQYRKNPETFLRNKCWNDELIYHNNGEPTKQSAEDKLASILVG